MDQTARLLMLPDDVLADVLRRLGLHGLAASRCVCKAWRAVVDDRRLLPADLHLLPLSVAGFFAARTFKELPEYLARPSSSTIAARYDYLETHDPRSLVVAQHCNGLLLLFNDLVLNPATRRWARLPPTPLPAVSALAMEDVTEDKYLVFDPTVSPHYEVFLFNTILYKMSPPEDLVEPATGELEWPPSPYVVHVFSSRTGQWETKPFIREGEAAGTIGRMQLTWSPLHEYAAYWRRALYVHQHDFLMRIPLLNDKYQVIKLLKSDDLTIMPAHYIGKSEKGVYCALTYELRLWIWLLDESCGQMKWMLKRDINLKSLLANSPWKHSARPWLVQIANCCNEGDNSEEAPTQQESCSNNDNVTVAEESAYSISLFGFHPYRETIFFRTSSGGRVMAYHFNGSKLEDLGCLPVKNTKDCIYAAFPYTPCRIGDLSDNQIIYKYNLD